MQLARQGEHIYLETEQEAIKRRIERNRMYVKEIVTLIDEKISK